MKYQIVNKYGYLVEVNLNSSEVDTACLERNHAVIEVYEIGAHNLYEVSASCKGFLYYRKFCKRYEIADVVVRGAQFLEHVLSAPQYAY
jgi:hypothetical protein